MYRLRQVSFCWTSHLISVLRTNQIRNCLLSNPMHSSCCVTPIPNNIVDLHLSFIKIHVPVIIFCWLPISVLCTYQKFVVEAPYLRWTLVKVRVTFVFFSLMFLYLFYMFFAKPLIISLYLLDLWKKNFTIYI